MDWIEGWVEGREEEDPVGPTQVAGPSTWWVAVPFPKMGKAAGRRGRCRNPV